MHSQMDYFPDNPDQSEDMVSMGMAEEDVVQLSGVNTGGIKGREDSVTPASVSQPEKVTEADCITCVIASRGECAACAEEDYFVFFAHLVSLQ